AVNAAVMPIVSRYLDEIESRLAALGATAPFYVMQSNGGVMTSASAKERPVYMVESGPAAGVITAGAVAAPYRPAHVLSFAAGGALRVGPRSAGARPGPACYGLGGATPTITDANLVLGRLNPAFFLGGEMTLDADAARRAVAERVAAPLGLDPLSAASGIVEI